jgi:hypothetical protein
MQNYPLGGGLSPLCSDCLLTVNYDKNGHVLSKLLISPSLEARQAEISKILASHVG